MSKEFVHATELKTKRAQLIKRRRTITERMENTPRNTQEYINHQSQSRDVLQEIEKINRQLRMQ